MIGKYSSNELIQKLRNEKFSMTIDESTDRECVKHLAIVVRHLSHKGISTDEFLTLIPVSNVD